MAAVVTASTKEASNLVHLLVSTPRNQRVTTWPSLLSLLTRWASTAAKGSQAPPPARPWERKQQQQRQRGQESSTVQQLLLQAATAVQEELIHAALDAETASSSATAQALGALLAPSLSFLASAVTAITGRDAEEEQQQQAAAAAACAAISAAATAAQASVFSAGSNSHQGLPAFLASFKALLLACKGNLEASTWLLSCLLSALHSAMPVVLHDHQQAFLHHLVRISSSGDNTAVGLEADDGQCASQSSSLDAWLQQQAIHCTVSGAAELLSGLFAVGHELGLSYCNVPTSASNLSTSSTHSGASSTSTSLPVLQSTTLLLSLACSDAADVQLMGLAASVAAGLCAGLLQGMPPATTAAADSSSFEALANAAWQGAGHVHQPQQPQQQHAAGSGIMHKSGVRSSSRRHPQAHAHRHAAHVSISHDNQQQQQQQQQPPQELLPGVQQQHRYGLWRQQLVREVQVLLAAISTACRRVHRLQTQQTTESASAALGRALLAHAYSKLMAGHAAAIAAIQLQNLAPPQQQQDEEEQPVHGLGLLFTLEYLTQQCCSLSGVFYHTAGCADAAAANRWLLHQQQRHAPQEVAMLVRWLATAAGSQQLPQQNLLQLLEALRASSTQLSQSFSCYQLCLQQRVAEQLDAAAVRQQLDRTFAVHVAVLYEVWHRNKSVGLQHQHPSAPPAQSPPAEASAMAADSHASPLNDPDATATGSAAAATAALVALSLADLASLQFCRVQLPAYMDLLRSLVTAVAENSMAADAFIAAALPCYDRLIAPQPASAPKATATSSTSTSSTTSSSRSSSPGAVWLHDSVLAAEVSFLLPLLPVAVRASVDAAAVAQRVLPFVLLLLPHPFAGVSQAAHSAFAGLLAIAAEQKQQQQQKMNSQHPQDVAHVAQQQPTQEGLPATDSAEVAATDQSPLQPQQQVQPEQQQHDLLHHQNHNQQQTLHLMQVVEQAVPMYLQRSLADLPGYSSLEGFAVGFHSLLRNLPPGSLMSVLAVSRVADRALELVAAGAGLQQPSTATRAASQHSEGNSTGTWDAQQGQQTAAGTFRTLGTSQLPASQQQQQQQEQAETAGIVSSTTPTRAAAVLSSPAAAAAGGGGAEQTSQCRDAANKLLDLLVLAISLIDYRLLPSCLQLVAACVLAAPGHVQQQWMSTLYNGCLAVGDYSRKPRLMHWIDELNKQQVQQQLHRKAQQRARKQQQQQQQQQLSNVERHVDANHVVMALS